MGQHHEAKYRPGVTWVYTLDPLQWLHMRRLHARFPPAKAVRPVYLSTEPLAGVEHVYLVGQPLKFDPRTEWVRVVERHTPDAQPVYVAGND